jgi:predicted lipid-binding transport protein (Tim44 family)
VPADLIVYALVAAGLVFWLRNILGTRNGEERQRENPLTKKPQLDPNPDNLNPYADEDRQISGEDLVRKLAEDSSGKISIENKNAEAGLLDICRADREFDVNFFLNGSQDAFAIIVEAFAANDKDTLKDLLGSNVYNAFENAINEREKRNEKQETQIRAIRKAEAIEARMSGRTAYITVRFTADETSVTKNSSGEVIDGHPDRPTAMRDVWTFSRDIKSRDPRWMVVETRGDFEDDNKILPNTIT